MSPSGKKGGDFSACWNQGALVLRGVCLWLVVVLRSTRSTQKNPEFFFKRVWAGFLPLAPYLFLVLCFKSVGLQPEFGLSGLACHAKSKSVGFFCSPALLDPRLEARQRNGQCIISSGSVGFRLVLWGSPASLLERPGGRALAGMGSVFAAYFFLSSCFILLYCILLKLPMGIY